MKIYFAQRMYSFIGDFILFFIVDGYWFNQLFRRTLSIVCTIS